MSWSITDARALEDAVLRLRSQIASRIGVRKGMTVVDMGCGQGGFTVSLAEIVGEAGKVLSVDVSDEYLKEFMGNLNRYNVKHLVTVVRADAADLKGTILDEVADMAVSYRFLEELKHPGDMGKIVKEMTRIVRKNGKVCITELSIEARNEAEENYIRLHEESGDSFFKTTEIVTAMKEAKLKKVECETFQTNIWFSPELAKQDLSLAQVWFTQEEEKRLGIRIDKYGMKYPVLLIFSGVK
jgi:cyclopropane fatty-acyl-phospholipid synthase-like methyltransferase